ncbi:hypothetical protein ABMB67_001671 [Halalkalibacter oceani]
MKKLPNSKQKILENTIPLLLSTTAITKPIKASAEEKSVAEITGLPTSTELMEVVKMLIDYSVIIGIGIGALVLLITRLYYYHPNEKYHKKAMESASNSIKGMTQILITPTVIIILLTVAKLLLGGLPNFQLPL